PIFSTPNKHLFNAVQFLARLKNREFQNLFNLVHTEDLTYLQLKRLLNDFKFKELKIIGTNHLISTKNPLFGIGLLVKAIK
ncbi:MAG: hypothetical protein KKF44_04160, partial [Nanoarchaeota archaeon]|nr:hypothetical protein [Nanoarchaeota archaeon]